MLPNILLQSSASLIFLNEVMFSRKFKKYRKMQSICVFLTFDRFFEAASDASSAVCYSFY